MTFIYISMVLLGLFGIPFGFWGQSNLRSPYDSVAAVFLPLSLVISLTGVLLLCVPHFFAS